MGFCVPNLAHSLDQMYTKAMPTDDQDDVAKKVEAYEQALPESERNPKAKKDFENLIERASKPLPEDAGTLPTGERYSGKQTRSGKTADTSAKRRGKSHR